MKAYAGEIIKMKGFEPSEKHLNVTSSKYSFPVYLS